MKAINGFDKVQAFTERVKLPAGGYIAKCIGAKVVTYSGKNGNPDFEKLEIAVDITEGEFADYYKNDYDANTTEDKKWKGVCRLYVPTDDGSEKDELTKRRLKGMTMAFEDSNSGYHWDWDETKLKGLKVGILVRDKEWEFNGKTGFAPEIISFTSVQNIRDGKYKVPNTKYLNGSSPANASTTAAPDTSATAPADDEYPF